MESKRQKLLSTWKIRPILSNEITSNKIETVKVFIDTIIERKMTSKIVKNLNDIAPVSFLTHLKRVNNNRIILILANDLQPNECVSELKQKGFDFIGLSGHPMILEVPKSMPKTHLQNTLARQFWPCNFHPDKQIESLLSNTYFSQLQLSKFENFMRLALTCAEDVCSGAVVVDPMNDSVIAQSADFRHEHPIKHAVMCVVDKVAECQGGGAWSKNINSSKITSKDKSGPYLCTGYDIFIVREPCIMCSMALVHSRVKRIFYGCSSIDGGLESLTSIHLLKGINHRFEVFGGILEKECKIVSSSNDVSNG